MPTSRYIDTFLMLADNEHPESFFLDDFSISHVSSNDNAGARRFTGDLVEIDTAGRLHLWLFAPLRATELISGDVIGRMFSFTQVLRIAQPESLREAILAAARRRRYDIADASFQALMARPRLEVDSWNVVICGGSGCELLAGDDNLLYQLYAPLAEMEGPIRDVNTWQFRRTATGYDLRSLWDVAGWGRLSVVERLDAYHGRAVLPAPEDDFDIRSKRDLKLNRRKGLHAEAHAALFGLMAAAE
jgi:hypothetical protein